MAFLTTSADHGVRFVDKDDDRARRVLDFLDQALQTVFEFAFDAGSGLQQGKVERAHGYVLQRWRNVAIGNADCEAFDDRSLTHARLASENRIVLAAAHEDVDHLTNFRVAPQYRVDLAGFGTLRQVHCKLVDVWGLAAGLGAALTGLSAGS